MTSHLGRPELQDLLKDIDSLRRLSLGRQYRELKVEERVFRKKYKILYRKKLKDLSILKLRTLFSPLDLRAIFFYLDKERLSEL